MPLSSTELSQTPSSQTVVLLLLTAGAAFLRFYKLGEWSFWFDEMYTLRDCHELGLPLFSAKPVICPLTWLSFKMFGVNEWSLRLFSAVGGVAAVPACYVLIRRMADDRTAILSSLLIMLSSWHIFQSQSGRYYALIFLFAAVSAFAFYLGVIQARPMYFVVSGVAFVLGVYTHLTIVFLLPGLLAFAGWYWIWRSSNGIKKWPVILMVGVVLFLAVFLWPMVMDMAKTVMEDKEVWSYGTIHLGLAFLNRVGPPLVLLAGVSLLGLFYQRTPLGWFLGFYAVLSSIPLVMIGWIANIRPDYFFWTLPGWFLLAGYGCSSIIDAFKLQGKALLGFGVVAALILSNMPSLVSYYVDGNRYPEREVAEYVKNLRSADDIVLSSSPGLTKYYGGGEPQQIKQVDLEALQREGKRIWLIVYYNRSGMSQVSGSIRDWIYQNARLVKEFIPRRFDYNENSVRVFLSDAMSTQSCHKELAPEDHIQEDCAEA